MLNYFYTVLDRIALLYEYLKQLMTLIMFNHIKRKARKYARKKRADVFVIKHQGNIRFITRNQFKHLRQHGIFKINMTAKELKEKSLYYYGYDKKRV